MRAPVLGQVGVLRGQGRFGSRLALLSAPSSSGGFWPVVRPLFLFSLPFQGLPVLGYRCVGVFSFFPFFFCVPRLVSRLGSLSSHVHFHLIFIFTSSTLLRQGVCVYHLNRCKTSYYRRSVWHSRPTTRNEAVGMSRKGNVAGFRPLQIIYICIVPPLGAFKSHLGGLIVNVYCDSIYIYIYTYLYI